MATNITSSYELQIKVVKFKKNHNFEVWDVGGFFSKQQFFLISENYKTFDSLSTSHYQSFFAKQKV